MGSSHSLTSAQTEELIKLAEFAAYGCGTWESLSTCKTFNCQGLMENVNKFQGIIKQAVTEGRTSNSHSDAFLKSVSYMLNSPNQSF